MSGNNKQALQIVRVSIPFFDEIGVASVPGKKYFFPEHPEIDKKNVVGIELHLGGGGGVLGEADNTDSKLTQIPPSAARFLFFCFINAKNEIIFENVPALSLYTKFEFTGQQNFKQSIQPYFGKIKTRASYVYIPANITTSFVDAYINLTFYLR